MRQALTAQTLAEFRQRFGRLHDGVIHDVVFKMGQKHTPRETIHIVVEACSWTAEGTCEWVNLRFEIEEVTKYALYQKRNYTNAVIFGMSIGFFGDEVFLDFTPYVDNPTSAEDFEKRPFDAPDMFLIIGQRCFWSVTPISG